MATEVGSHTLTTQQIQDLKDQVRFSHGASARHVHQLLAPLGMPFALDEISWKGFPKGSARTLLDDIAMARNRVAHGDAAKAKTWVVDLERWHRLVPKVADELDRMAGEHVRVKQNLSSPPW